MTPLTKTFLAFLAVAALVTGTVAMRSSRASHDVVAAPSLTPAQLAEINPPQKSSPPSALSAQPKPADVDIPPPPDDEPEIEDGNGS